MLHVNTDPKDYCFVLNGSLADISADIGYIINKTHLCLSKQSSIMAELFRHGMIQSLTMPNSPIWGKEQMPGEIIIATSKPKDGD